MIEFAMLKILQNSSAVQAVFGSRIYAQQLPQESIAPGAPSACYKRVASQRGYVHRNESGVPAADKSVKAMTTIYIVGSTYGDVQAGSNAIRQALEAYCGGGVVSGVVLQDGGSAISVRIGNLLLDDERDADLQPIGAKELSANQRELDFSSLFWE